MPKLYIISGCNGSGKSTLAKTVLPELLNCFQFLNADDIARAISPFNPEESAIDAGRILLRKLKDLISLGKDVAFETTLSSRSFVPLIEAAIQNGYNCELIFLWLSSPELAVLRVKSRVQEGGHSIPEEIIRRRYVSGLKNFFELYAPICNVSTIYDQSDGFMKPLARYSRGGSIEYFNKELVQHISQSILMEDREEYRRQFERMNAGLALSFKRLLLEKKQMNRKLVVTRKGKIVESEPEEFPEYREALEEGLDKIAYSEFWKTIKGF